MTRTQSEIAAQQYTRLQAMIEAALLARDAASRGDLFASDAGRVLVEKAFDLFECDGLYDLAGDVLHEIGREEAA